MKQAIAVYVKKAIVKIAKEFAVIESNQRNHQKLKNCENFEVCRKNDRKIS